MNSVPLSYKYDGIALSIESVCGVSGVLLRDENINADGQPMAYYRAQWDTGAMYTVISERIVRELQLNPIRCMDNYTANGLVKSMMYKIHLVMPNGIILRYVNAVCCNLDDADIDMLIGMNVITLCDFAITNVEEKTTFSFQIPSATTIDFEKSRK